MTARIRTHPDEILKEEFLVPLGMSANALARELGIPANRVTAILKGTRGVLARAKSGRAIERAVRPRAA